MVAHDSKNISSSNLGCKNEQNHRSFLFILWLTTDKIDGGK